MSTSRDAGKAQALPFRPVPSRSYIHVRLTARQFRNRRAMGEEGGGYMKKSTPLRVRDPRGDLSLNTHTRLRRWCDDSGAPVGGSGTLGPPSPDTTGELAQYRHPSTPSKQPLILLLYMYSQKPKHSIKTNKHTYYSQLAHFYTSPVMRLSGRNSAYKRTMPLPSHSST